MTKFRWSEIPYPYKSISQVKQGINFEYVQLTFFEKYPNEKYKNIKGEEVTFHITYPDVTFDFRGFELNKVKKNLLNDTKIRRKIIEFWNPDDMLNKFIKNTINLMDVYDTPATNGSRLLSILNDSYKDSLKICNFFKKNFDIPRPIQVDNSINTIIETPYSPSYPSEAGVCAGVTKELLSYFFAPEVEIIEKMCNQSAYASFYSGINYEIDVTQGLRLGKSIGRIIVDIVSKESDSLGCIIDLDFKKYKNARLEFPR